MKLPIYGLLLVGGKSQRMGQDKALLRYAAETQLERGVALLQSVCAQVAISQRPEQDYPRPKGTISIHDQRIKGPLRNSFSHAGYPSSLAGDGLRLTPCDCATRKHSFKSLKMHPSSPPIKAAMMACRNRSCAPSCGCDQALLSRASSSVKPARVNC